MFVGVNLQNMTFSSSNGILWVTLSGGLFGVIGLAVRAILRSKCKEFSCCFGLIRCLRDSNVVVPEEDIETGQVIRRSRESRGSRTSESSRDNHRHINDDIDDRSTVDSPSTASSLSISPFSPLKRMKMMRTFSNFF
jgi:hypothetical protein